MKSKNVLTIALLLFVAASVVALGVKSLRRSPPTATAANQMADGVIAYYFHGKTRCPTCRNIEAYAQEAIEGGFAEQLEDGLLQWRVVNYELPENEHFAIDFELVAPTVVLVEVRGGSQKTQKNLARVWELVGDKEAFVKYVREETQALLRGFNT